MPDDRSPVPASALPSPMATGLTRAEFDALARELRDAYGLLKRAK